MYPDRPIRPLPKRTIKERLSPQQAGSIIYPPAPPSTTPLLGFSYNQSDKMNAGGQRLMEHGEHTCDCGADHSEPESDDEYMIRGPRPADRSAYGLSEHGARMRSSLGPAGTPSKVGYPPQPLSTASSADGYESFENMSNKKKRKIPNHVNGSGGSHASSLDRDMASLDIQHAAAANGEANGIDSADGLSTVNGNYNGARAATAPPSGPGMGISGPGRGRNGRPSTRNSAGERKPLGSSANALNAYANGRANRPRRDQNGTAAANKGREGIISAAIASAAEQAPVTPQKGNENVSLLSQQAATSSQLPSPASSQKTQFTFTCGSDSANKVNWPPQNGSPQTPSAPHNRAAPPGDVRRNVATHSTQTGHPVPNGTHNPVPQHSGQYAPPPQPVPGHSNGQQAPPPPPNPKPRRRRNLDASLRAAAKQRRLQQEYQNFHAKNAEIWICDHLRAAPEALIRQYEIKDRRERRRQEEKRRLLEKAKMRNKNKGRKGGKKGAKTDLTHAPPPTPLDNQQYADEGYDDVDGEYFDDEHEDGMPPVPQPPPMPGAYVGDTGGGRSKVPLPQVPAAPAGQPSGGTRAA
ncbi:hypothetical protein H2199_002786 [Coniosporium tulheliwenetii]|uniref:Uncharacterized protein n=1 Tax=Coniosporium tulheliwenetii TaxID=3383036 RepID=A0ACC2ZEP5_9PEZI|nr:hypothetical protein H2199_002786 [Cladosporium sp. JES 115]